eukprot:CAMPEP_0170468044 /NCGR_PEP_ID=MMETSP0123-20130129/11378_1 /TAXON_ID=182087 /ORGANISM="Favella ehrenbergii, Strain Fehren 1" /LENGTH=122 /DNA_ID=CAMNT_0010734527 /DNA_START=414 /DNA_END=782 /DNA_ORIENTATION=-
MEGFEEFALNDGWKKVGEESQIPVGLQGVEAWARWFAMQKAGVLRDIDNAWRQYGLFNYIPAPYHYWLVLCISCAPFLLIVSLLCCLSDEEDDKPQYSQDAQQQQQRPRSPKKNSVRAEKLD